MDHCCHFRVLRSGLVLLNSVGSVWFNPNNPKYIQQAKWRLIYSLEDYALCNALHLLLGTLMLQSLLSYAKKSSVMLVGFFQPNTSYLPLWFIVSSYVTHIQCPLLLGLTERQIHFFISGISKIATFSIITVSSINLYLCIQLWHDV